MQALLDSLRKQLDQARITRNVLRAAYEDKQKQYVQACASVQAMKESVQLLEEEIARNG